MVGGDANLGGAVASADRVKDVSHFQVAGFSVVSLSSLCYLVLSIKLNFYQTCP